MPLPTYAKTPAGIDEITARSRGLAPRLRRLLILVDGQRDDAELAALLGDTTVAEQLAALEAAGLIAPDPATPAGPTTRTAPNIPATPAPTPPPAAVLPALSPQQLERAKALMSDSVVRYLGVLGRPLLASIAGALDSGTLRTVSAAWHMALRESRHGRAEADLLLHTLRELLEVG